MLGFCFNSYKKVMSICQECMGDPWHVRRKLIPLDEVLIERIVYKNIVMLRSEWEIRPVESKSVVEFINACINYRFRGVICIAFVNIDSVNIYEVSKLR